MPGLLQRVVDLKTGFAGALEEECNTAIVSVSSSSDVEGWRVINVGG